MGSNTVTIGTWDEEEGMYTNLEQIPVVANVGDKLPPVGSLVYVTTSYRMESGIYYVATPSRYHQ